MAYSAYVFPWSLQTPAAAQNPGKQASATATPELYPKMEKKGERRMCGGMGRWRKAEKTGRRQGGKKEKYAHVQRVKGGSAKKIKTAVDKHTALEREKERERENRNNRNQKR